MSEYNKLLERLERGTSHERAAAIALRYGTAEGEHHKQWVIDQMLRIIAGMAYPEIINVFNDNADSEKWDTGIAP